MMRHTNVVYTAHVNGWAWAGYEASTEYEFDHKPSDAEIQARAGDFERIESFTITRTTTLTEAM